MASRRNVMGLAELQWKLSQLAGRGSDRAMRAGMRAALRPMVKAVRAAVNASDASPDVKREARKTIGQRFKRAFGIGQREAKVGFAVGKKQNKKTGTGRSGGVGLSTSNIHWFVLGTAERSQKSGRYTGRVKPVLKGLTWPALTAGAPAALAAAKVAIARVLRQEAKKKG